MLRLVVRKETDNLEKVKPLITIAGTVFVSHISKCIDTHPRYSTEIKTLFAIFNQNRPEKRVKSKYKSKPLACT
jgi:hypothetical protein